MAVISGPDGLPMDLERSYRVLGLRSDADMLEVRTRFRSLALEYHPDKNKSPEAAGTFAVINEAYAVIVNSRSAESGFRAARQEPHLDEDGDDMAFSILTDKERVYHVPAKRFESAIRSRFNPRLATDVYCKVGGRWFETDGKPPSAWSRLRGSGRSSRIIEWGRGPDRDRWKTVTWDDFWSYVRRCASLHTPRQEQDT